MDGFTVLLIVGGLLYVVYTVAYKTGHEDGFNTGVCDTLDILVHKKFITDDDIDLLNKGETALSRTRSNDGCE